MSVILEQDPLTHAIPTPEEVQMEIPLRDSQAAFVQHCRDQIEGILKGWDHRRLLIAGPCSLHDPASAVEYARRLKALSEEVSDHFFLIMRAYVEKPRTIIGWKGMLYDPDLDGTYDVAKGVRQTRQLLSTLTEIGVPLGCEILEINTSYYYTDFLSWGCIGARTSSSQPHRQLASSLDFPIGFKNSVDGNVDAALHGILAAATPHVYLGLTSQGQIARLQTEGNPLCHVVVRGGIHGPNYHHELLHPVVATCRKHRMIDRIIVDCSHDNCGKKPLEQKKVFNNLVERIVSSGDFSIGGMMLESHLFSGTQEISFPLNYGVSITDPCLDWETTETLILDACRYFN